MKGSEKMSNYLDDENPFYFLESNIDYYNNKYSRKSNIKDHGGEPYVVDIEEVTKENNVFRRAIWTGKYLQVTLMCINPGEDIGLEIHEDTDQFLRIKSGNGIVKMGKDKDKLEFEKKVNDDYAIVIPAGTWHNVYNTGNKLLKLYSIYAPPHHPKGTVHITKNDQI